MSNTDSSLFDSSLDVSFFTPTKPLSASYLPSFGGVAQLFDPHLAVTPEQAAAWRSKQVRFNPAISVKETSYFSQANEFRSPTKSRDGVGREIGSNALFDVSSPTKKPEAAVKRVSPKKATKEQPRVKVSTTEKKSAESAIEKSRKELDLSAKLASVEASAKGAARSLRFSEDVNFAKVEYNSTLRTFDALRSLETQLKTGSEPTAAAFENFEKKSEIKERSSRALNIAPDRAVFRELPGVEVTRGELERAKALGRRTHDAANRELLRAAAQRNAATMDDEEEDSPDAAVALGDEPITQERPSLAFRSVRQQMSQLAPYSYTPRAFEFLVNVA